MGCQLHENDILIGWYIWGGSSFVLLFPFPGSYIYERTASWINVGQDGRFEVKVKRKVDSENRQLDGGRCVMVSLLRTAGL